MLYQDQGVYGKAESLHERALAIRERALDISAAWTEDERVLALDLYLKHRGKPPDATHRDVLELSDTLRALGPLQGNTHRAAACNPGG